MTTDRPFITEVEQALKLELDKNEERLREMFVRVLLENAELRVALTSAQNRGTEWINECRVVSKALDSAVACHFHEPTEAQQPKYRAEFIDKARKAMKA